MISETISEEVQGTDVSNRDEFYQSFVPGIITYIN